MTSYIGVVQKCPYLFVFCHDFAIVLNPISHCLQPKTRPVETRLTSLQGWKDMSDSTQSIYCPRRGASPELLEKYHKSYDLVCSQIYFYIREEVGAIRRVLLKSFVALICPCQWKYG